jgi:hypothetical protein
MEKKKKKAPMLLIFGVTLAVGSLISILNGGVSIRPLISIVKLVYFAVMNTPGEDLAAIFLVVTVLSVGAIAAITYFIPRIKLRSEKRTKIAVWALQLTQIVLVVPPVVAGAVVSIRLSLWFIIPVLILTVLGSMYLISRVWLLNFKGRNRA